MPYSIDEVLRNFGEPTMMESLHYLESIHGQTPSYMGSSISALLLQEDLVVLNPTNKISPEDARSSALADTTIKVCCICKSPTCYYDAYVDVNDTENVLTFDTIICDNCGKETTLEEITNEYN